MGFIRLTKMSSKALKLSSNTDKRNFKGRYNDALEDDDNETITKIFSDFYHLWVPCDKFEVKEILINTDRIECCVEEYANSELISDAHIKLLPRVSKVFLKGHKEEYLVLESAREIQSLIEKAFQK